MALPKTRGGGGHDGEERPLSREVLVLSPYICKAASSGARNAMLVAKDVHKGDLSDVTAVYPRQKLPILAHEVVATSHERQHGR